MGGLGTTQAVAHRLSAFYNTAYMDMKGIELKSRVTESGWESGWRKWREKVEWERWEQVDWESGERVLETSVREEFQQNITSLGW